MNIQLAVYLVLLVIGVARSSVQSTDNWQPIVTGTAECSISGVNLHVLIANPYDYPMQVIHSNRSWVGSGDIIGPASSRIYSWTIPYAPYRVAFSVTGLWRNRVGGEPIAIGSGFKVFTLSNYSCQRARETSANTSNH